MSEILTKLQQREHLFQEWFDGDRAGEPPERMVFRSKRHQLSAAIDPFANADMGVVVYPHTGEAGKPGHVFELGFQQYRRVMTVAHAVGSKIMRAAGAPYTAEQRASGLRVITRIDGFAVPEDPHIVMSGAPRGAEPLPKPDTAELDRRHDALRLRPYEATVLLGMLDDPGAVGNRTFDELATAEVAARNRLIEREEFSIENYQGVTFDWMRNQTPEPLDY